MDLGGGGVEDGLLEIGALGERGEGSFSGAWRREKGGSKFQRGSEMERRRNFAGGF